MDNTSTERDSTPAETSFDELARGVGDGSLSRRRALALVGSSLFGGTFGSLALLGNADAADKKKKRRRRKKKKKDDQQQPPVPVGTGILGPSFACPNLGTACGLGTNTLVCNCRLTKEGTQTCANVVNPPNGAAFQACQQTVNCPPGQICDFGGNVCRTTCATG